MNTEKISRREVLTTLAAGAAGALIARGARADDAPQAGPLKLKGRLKQSVCRWCYGGMELDELCKNAAAMGIQSVELQGEKEWPTIKKYGLTCAMPNGPGGIDPGWNETKRHDKFVKESERLLPLIAAAGLPNMIVLSGNRHGMSDWDGLENCVKGFKRIIKLAEEQKVTLCLELLNSKHDHLDYMCDRTAWGVEVCKRVESPRMKLLYDIYHMQIMEGDIVDTIQRNIQYIGHFHTGGVPGRNELDETQELNWRRVAQAIADLKFDGFVSHEFIPKRDPMTSLRQAVQIFDV